MTLLLRAMLLTFIALLTLYLANRLYDYKVPHWVSRKVAHIGGGFCYILLPFLFPSPWYPLALSAGFTAILAIGKILNPNIIRGTGGSGRPGVTAEINFPLSGTVSIIILWALLDRPFLSILPMAFVGIGDAATGIIRSAFTNVESKGNLGSLGMITSCLLLASLASPYWVGAVGAVTATVAERATKASKIIDDNLTLTLSSLLIISLLVVGGKA